MAELLDRGRPVPQAVHNLILAQPRPTWLRLRRVAQPLSRFPFR